MNAGGSHQGAFVDKKTAVVTGGDGLEAYGISFIGIQPTDKLHACMQLAAVLKQICSLWAKMNFMMGLHWTPMLHGMVQFGRIPVRLTLQLPEWLHNDSG